jgi:hypothetical protein
MQKRLTLFVGLILIIAIVLVARFDKDYGTPVHSYDIKCVQPGDPSSSPASLSCALNPIQNANRNEFKPPWWHKLVTWPEGVTAWLILLTLGAITWQAWETRKAAEATAQGVDLGRQEFIATFRPRIHIRKMQMVEFVTNRVKVLIYLANIGQTNAKISSGWLKLNKIYWVGPEEQEFVIESPIKEATLVPGQSHVIEIVDERIGSFCQSVRNESDREGIQRSWLECQGELRYLDENNTVRTIGLSRRYDLRTKTFVSTGPEDDYED